MHWSTVMRVTTNEGPIYFKATAGETIYEIALTQLLASLQPNVVPELIAVDAARGWMLMRYGGEQPQHPLTHTRCESVEPVIIEYARLQMGLAEYVDAILALGSSRSSPCRAARVVFSTTRGYSQPDD
ncbi:MAG: hypothetical protein U0X92_01325 [Anaerolineales bacterium]